MFGDEEKLDKVAKALYQHMGLTSKKPGVLPSKVELEAQGKSVQLHLFSYQDFSFLELRTHPFDNNIS